MLMKLLLFIVFCLIIIQKCTTYDFAIGYMVVKVKDGIRYSYRDHLYRTKEDVAQEVMKNHPTVKQKKLFLVKVAEISHSTRLIDPNNYKYENVIEIYNRNPCRVILYEFCVHGRIYYKCFNKKFHSFNEAELYAKKKDSLISYFCCYKHINNNNKSKDLLKKVGKGDYSAKVWHSIWKTCYKYSCFSRNNFENLKIRYVFEINIHRIEHKGSPIRQNTDLTFKAEKYLEEILEETLDLESFNLPKRYLQIYTRIPTYMAPLLIKQWYDESKYYTFSTDVLIKKAIHFSSIVWREVRYVGFAIRETCNNLHIVYLFHPTPNIRRGFSDNVLKRKTSFRESLRNSIRSPLRSSFKTRKFSI
uniref:SCP domain-containing protein n=1 Tax=Strongyloides venezuelensis TaxID=75913 RepID=A0A0K0G234_STRVS